MYVCICSLYVCACVQPFVLNSLAFYSTLHQKPILSDMDALKCKFIASTNKEPQEFYVLCTFSGTPRLYVTYLGGSMVPSYNFGLKFQNPGQNFLLGLSPKTDGFTPELKTNEEQKQACAVLFLAHLYFSIKKKF